MHARKRKRLDSAKQGCMCIVHMRDSNNEKFTFIKDTTDPEERFEKLKTIKLERQLQPLHSPYRMDNICEHFPDSLSEIHGYHRDCYIYFTSNLGRLQSAESDMPSTSGSRMKRSQETKEKVIFKPDCIFCNKESRKKVKVRGSWTTEGLSQFDHDGSDSVLQKAHDKQDFSLLRRISGYDLFACEAKYHASCRRNYVSDPTRWLSKDIQNLIEQSALEAAHRLAFDAVCEIVTRRIVVKKDIIKLSELCAIYKTKLEQTAFSNPNYRSENLKVKLEKTETFKDLIGFCPITVTGNSIAYLVFSLKTDICEAIKLSYKLGSCDKVEECAKSLRGDVLKTFHNLGNPAWPPTAHDLNLNILPNSLQTFLSRLMFDTKYSSTKSKRIVSSIGQDICRAITNGEWILPKHILLGMIVRHLFRSAELMKLLNKLGHSENYCFLLELETALAEGVDHTSSILPLQIVRHPSGPSLFHSDFDNFDAFVNDLSGAGSVHRAHGIMLQETCVSVHHEIDGFQPVIPPTPRTGSRSMAIQPEYQLDECYLGKRLSPQFEVINTSTEGGQKAYKNYFLKSMLWVLIRLHASRSKKKVPGLAGYVSLIGEAPCRLTTIEFYPIIPCAITNLSTVRECLMFAEKGTHEVGQDYVITTFDLGVCMKAYPLVWNNKVRYEKHIIMIGTFHLLCAFFKMLGKKMQGSGFSDILLEAGLSSPGSLNGVVSGKNYARALYCHKTILEALERTLMSIYLKESDNVLDKLPSDSKKLLNDLIDNPNPSTEKSVLNDQRICQLLDNYLLFRDSVRDGKLGKTAQFWMSYIDHCWLAFILIQAVKTNNFESYAQCLCLMSELFFSFDGQNYARYLTFFSMFIVNIESSHPGATELLRRGAFSVARSFIPGDRCAVDKTIEETFMKHSKSKGGCAMGAGLTGLQTNYRAYQSCHVMNQMLSSSPDMDRWTKSTKERTKYLQTLYSFADMTEKQSSGQIHRDNRPTEIQRGEKQVIKTIAAIEGFNNPFDLSDKEKVYCLSSGASASHDVEVDILSADSVGKDAKERFINDRLKEKKDFLNAFLVVNLKR